MRLTRRGLKRRRLGCSQREASQSTNIVQCHDSDLYKNGILKNQPFL